jgi:hypothetical protein
VTQSGVNNDFNPHKGWTKSNVTPGERYTCIEWLASKPRITPWRDHHLSLKKASAIILTWAPSRTEHMDRSHFPSHDPVGAELSSDLHPWNVCFAQLTSLNCISPLADACPKRSATLNRSNGVLFTKQRLAQKLMYKNMQAALVRLCDVIRGGVTSFVRKNYGNESAYHEEAKGGSFSEKTA